jgi:Amt family ammonium transporter
MLALVLVSAYAFAGSWMLYRLVDALWPMRVSEDAEAMGLDLSQHQEVAATFEARRDGVDGVLTHVA